METKETIVIIPDGDKLKVTRVNEELITFEDAGKIHLEIAKGIAETEKQLADIPGQVAQRTDMLQKQLDTLKQRVSAFVPFAMQKTAEKTLEECTECNASIDGANHMTE